MCLGPGPAFGPTFCHWSRLHFQLLVKLLYLHDSNPFAWPYDIACDTESPRCVCTATAGCRDGLSISPYSAAELCSCASPSIQPRWLPEMILIPSFAFMTLLCRLQDFELLQILLILIIEAASLPAAVNHISRRLQWEQPFLQRIDCTEILFKSEPGTNLKQSRKGCIIVTSPCWPAYPHALNNCLAFPIS